MDTREVWVAPERIAGWIDRFGDRHGGFLATGTDEVLNLVAGDGEAARLTLPGRSLSVGDDPVGALIAAATDPRVLGLLLIRRGGYSVGVAEGAAIVAHRSGTRYLQGRTAAGGWSQQRFARRRANQAKAALDKAREAVVDVVMPRAADLDEVVAAGERQAVREVLSDPEVHVLGGLLRQDMLPSGPATYAALGDLLTRARSVSVLMTTGRDDAGRHGSP
jgi:hypothetical protein